MIEINIVIDLKAKLEESRYIRVEEEEKRKKEKNVHNTTNLVLELKLKLKVGLHVTRNQQFKFLI